MDPKNPRNYVKYWSAISNFAGDPKAFATNVSALVALGVPYHVVDPANRIMAQPCTIWIKVVGENIVQLYMCDIGDTPESDSAYRLPEKLNFLIHNRLVVLAIESEDRFLNPEVIPKIKAIFGPGTRMDDMELHKTCLTTDLVNLATYFSVRRVHVRLENDPLPVGLTDLGSITNLRLDGKCCMESLLCLENSRNVEFLSLTLNIDNQTTTLINHYLQQWKNGDRAICNWQFIYDRNWFLRNKTYSQDDPFADHFLQLEVSDYSGNQKKAVFLRQTLVGPANEMEPDAPDSTTDED